MELGELLRKILCGGSGGGSSDLSYEALRVLPYPRSHSPDIGFFAPLLEKYEDKTHVFVAVVCKVYGPIYGPATQLGWDWHPGRGGKRQTKCAWVFHKVRTSTSAC